MREAIRSVVSKYRVWQRHLILRALYYFGYSTIAARALIIQNDQVLLIRHSYIPQWHTVGGGVDKGETPMQAVKRELLEEIGLECVQEPKLFGIYHNGYKNSNDYKVIYVVNQWIISQDKATHALEIAESRMFDMKALPQDISEPTLHRIQEYIGLRPMSEQW